MIMRARVVGRVQGVGFRFWVVQQARVLGLGGWVRNAFDQAVEIEAEGEETGLRELEQRLWTGPVLSHVTDVRARYLDGSRNHSEFEVKF